MKFPIESVFDYFGFLFICWYITKKLKNAGINLLEVDFFKFQEKNSNSGRDSNLQNSMVRIPGQVQIFLLKSEILILQSTKYKFVSTYHFDFKNLTFFW